MILKYPQNQFKKTPRGGKSKLMRVKEKKRKEKKRKEKKRKKEASTEEKKKDVK